MTASTRTIRASPNAPSVDDPGLRAGHRLRAARRRAVSSSAKTARAINSPQASNRSRFGPPRAGPSNAISESVAYGSGARPKRRADDDRRRAARADLEDARHRDPRAARASRANCRRTSARPSSSHASRRYRSHRARVSRASSSSRICTALVAAPLRSWSPTAHSLNLSSAHRPRRAGARRAPRPFPRRRAASRSRCGWNTTPSASLERARQFGSARRPFRLDEHRHGVRRPDRDAHGHRRDLKVRAGRGSCASRRRPCAPRRCRRRASNAPTCGITLRARSARRRCAARARVRRAAARVRRPRVLRGPAGPRRWRPDTSRR